MSIDRRVYVGPFVRCRRKTEEVRESRKGCVKPACRRFRDWRAAVRWQMFCPDCGYQLGEWRELVTRDAVDVEELTGGALSEVRPMCSLPWQDEWAILLPNEDRDPPREFRVEGDVLLDLIGVMECDEFLWLKQAFAAELVKLREAFGADGVDVRWGVVAWSS